MRAEVVVVGGGPAGLSAALTLGRSLVETVVIDARAPRSAASAHSHGFFTRDGMPPHELLDAGRRDLARYASVTLLDDTVEDVVAVGGGFEARTAGGRAIAARRVLLATGRQERPADIGVPDIGAVYGVSVFPCPFCDGWERRGWPLAVFGRGAELAGYARLIGRWTDDLILFSNGVPVGAPGAGILVEDAPIARLDHDGGALRAVVLDDGRSVARAGGFVFTAEIERVSPLPARLGERAGVHVAGDLSTGFGGVADAAAEGYRAAKAIVRELVAEDAEVSPSS